MRIATNVSALNAWRNLSGTNNSLAKTLEKLSSGYRINRAADDAAGLAISEKMRGQIAGLNMAVKNAQDGISLIQTGEGAVNEVHAILTRMEELAVQAASDTNTSEDRAKMQAEMDQLAQEVSRIGSTTEFNTLKLLDGTFSGQDIVFHVGANEDQNLRIRIGDMRSRALALAGDATVEGFEDVQGTLTYAATPSSPTLEAGTYTVEWDDAGGQYVLHDSGSATAFVSTDGITYSDGTDSIEFDQAVYRGTVTITNEATADNGATATIAGGAIVAADLGSAAVADGATAGEYDLAIGSATYSSTDGGYTYTDGTTTISFSQAVVTGDTVTLSNSGTAAAGDLSLTTSLEAGVYTAQGYGPTSTLVDQNGFLVGVWDQSVGTDGAYVDPEATGTVVFDPGASGPLGRGEQVAVGGVDISTNQEAANAALPTLRAALELVSSQRSLFGATQNRLEHTINNLQVAAENLSAAESRIRDVDMAAEMANFTRNQILLQAGTAMLAQANAAPQSVLQLLG